MKRYFVIAGLLFLALTINIAWTGKAPWLGFWGLTATFVFGTLFNWCWHVYRGVVSPFYPPGLDLDQRRCRDLQGQDILADGATGHWGADRLFRLSRLYEQYPRLCRVRSVGCING